MSDLAINEIDFTEQKNIREQYITKIEILDKVKSLFLIPEMEVMTTQMIAEYFKVDISVIKMCYKRNKKEIDLDGVELKSVDEMRRFWKSQAVTSENIVGGLQVVFNGEILKMNNKGTKTFSKRAILRIAMLLRDSVVAKEVRTQLLNTFEKTTYEQKTEEIDNEQELLLDLAKSYVNRDFDGFASANQNYIAYQKRHIKQVEEQNTTLSQDNKMLAGEILKWTDRACLNKAVRILATKLTKPFGVMFNELYDELRYKHSIGLSQRGEKPYIQHIKEDEWGKVIQSFSAICESYKVNSSQILEKAKIDHTEEVTV